MILKEVSEVVYFFYERGRALATAKTYDKEDISMFVRMGVSNKMVQNFYATKKLNEGDEYYITSALLSVQRFELSAPDSRGMRRADMSKFDVYRLPKNAHVVNAYPVGCGGTESKSITIVAVGEEYFYQKPKFDSFKFGVPKGRGINTYHLPPCAKFLDVESTFDSDFVDVSLDVAYEVAREVLGVMLGVPFQAGKDPENTYAEVHSQLRQRVNQQQP
jgi:hypothetical protein